MGNPQHLEWLLEGVESWNKRREEEPFTPDLSEFNIRQTFIDNGIIKQEERLPLGGADLGGANLGGADLGGANLGGAYLFRADLGGANLNGAELDRANLFEADLTEANLIEADLRRADLGGADLGEADLERANLGGADLTTIVYSGVGTNDADTPEYTDLSNARFLTQKQIDLAKGDTGTILPDDLTRPNHWPDWRDQLGEQKSETPPQPPKQPITKSTPPAEFETVGDQINVALSPLNPMPRRASSTPIDTDLRNQKVEGIKIVAEQLVEQLDGYDDEDTNRATVATQLQKAAGRLHDLACAGGERLIIHAFYQINEAIGRSYSEDAHALETADREMYKSLVDAGRNIYPMYPALADQLEPAHDQLVPDDTDVRSEHLIEALEDVLYNDKTRAFFTDETRRVFEAEKQALAPIGRNEEKDKIVRFGGLLGEMHNEMEQTKQTSQKIRNHAEWIAASTTITQAWQLVAPFLGV